MPICFWRKSQSSKTTNFYAPLVSDTGHVQHSSCQGAYLDTRKRVCRFIVYCRAFGRDCLAVVWFGDIVGCTRPWMMGSLWWLRVDVKLNTITSWPPCKIDASSIASRQAINHTFVFAIYLSHVAQDIDCLPQDDHRLFSRQTAHVW